jgi:2-succinyl-5-enolpyruvyl-6-hydroxy-3-cyclohexene-1-carboxylate synthase
MTPPNRNTVWAETLVDELSAAGVEAASLTPGSRSTPLTVAFANHPDIAVFSHLDERSSAFFALGRGRRTGAVTALVCTSGTAAGNYHPAVMEADEGRVPLLALTADRPPALQESGANQTTDQTDLYGDAVRWQRTLPEPEPDARKLRSLRVTAGRAVAEAEGVPAGPVHLDVPFRKPLEPVEVPGDVSDEFLAESTLAVDGRTGPFVETTAGQRELSASDIDALAKAIDNAERTLVVAGPEGPPTPTPEAVKRFVEATSAPVLADPLSGLRFGSQVADRPVCGGYDSYLDAAADWPDPDLVLRFGASPTSKVLREYLQDVDAGQLMVDPAGEWREATFTATDLVTADPTDLLDSLADAVSAPSADSWRDRFVTAEKRYWELVEDGFEDQFQEGTVLHDVASGLPDSSTLFVSNSMPVRDLDRYGRPRSGSVSVLGNRGVSGIDGIVSTALGAGSATTDSLVLVTGDLAYYHDMNGLLAINRSNVDATIVLINNDGGGIFHQLPIESFDPPFTSQFKTPHGLDFEPTGDLYGFDYQQVEDRAQFQRGFAETVGSGETSVIEVRTDAEESHRRRERLHERVCEHIP